MYTRQQFIDKLTVLVTEAMGDVWEKLDKIDEDALAEHVGWIGRDVDRLMAKAAVAVVEATADVQDTMRQNGVNLES